MDDFDQITPDDISLAARLIREKYGDGPTSVRMSRETYRLFIVTANILPGNEPTKIYGMPIIFDESIPTGTLRKDFAEPCRHQGAVDIDGGLATCVDCGEAL